MFKESSIHDYPRKLSLFGDGETGRYFDHLSLRTQLNLMSVHNQVVEGIWGYETVRSQTISSSRN